MQPTFREMMFPIEGTDMTPNQARGFKVVAGESRTGEHYKMKGVTANTLDVKISGADSNGGLSIMEQVGQSPQGGPPLHLHPDQDEFFYVVEGEYQFEVGGERFGLSAGDTIFLPRAVPHAFIQLSQMARMVVGYQPAGQMEGFFRTTAAWTNPPSKEEVAQVFASHGMRVVGPPLKVS